MISSLNIRKIIILFPAALIIVCISLFLGDKYFNRDIKIGRANLDHALSGFAWGLNIGWVSFNAINCDSDCNGSACVSEGGSLHPGCPAAGVNYGDYGVDIDVNGNLSGYAWSNNAGWIYFGPDNGSVQIVDAPEEPFEWGKVNVEGAGARITGWAKILSMGGNGWLKLSDDSKPSWDGRGARIDDTYIGELGGWAWNNNDNGAGIGWISFASANCDNDGTVYINNDPAGCPAAGADYHPYGVLVDPAELNHPPEIDGTSAPNIGDYCSATVRRAFLQWVFYDPDAGDSQEAYRIIFDDDNLADFESENLFDTGKCDHGAFVDYSTNGIGLCASDGNASSFSVHEIIPLDYGQDYYWWIKIWDSRGLESAWHAGANFQVPDNEYPDPDFTWAPQEFSQGEEVKFISLSDYYTQDTPNPCDDGNCNYEWSTDMNGAFEDPNSSETIIVFSDNNPGTVTLKVTDLDGNSCSEISGLLTPKLELPVWKETR